MLDFFGKALEWLKSPKRWFAVLIVSAILLRLPEASIQRLGLADVRQRYLPWISLCGIFSSAVLLVEFGAWLKTPFEWFREKRNHKAVLRALTPPEMGIIAEYFKQQTDTQYFNANDGLACGLAAKGLIYRSTTVSRGPFPVFGYNLQPWVRNILMKDTALLQAFAIVSARKASSTAG